MTRDIDTWEPADGELGLRIPEGGTIRVGVSQVAVTSASGIPVTLAASLELERDVWDRIDARELLGLTRDARGPGTVGGDGPVRLEARLDDDVLAAVYTGEQLTAEDAWAALRDDAPGWDDAYRTDAWFALTVVSDVLPDALATGLRTRWADADELASGTFEGGEEPVDL